MTDRIVFHLTEQEARTIHKERTRDDIENEAGDIAKRIRRALDVQTPEGAILMSLDDRGVRVDDDDRDRPVLPNESASDILPTRYPKHRLSLEEVRTLATGARIFTFQRSGPNSYVFGTSTDDRPSARDWAWHGEVVDLLRERAGKVANEAIEAEAEAEAEAGSPPPVPPFAYAAGITHEEAREVEAVQDEAKRDDLVFPTVHGPERYEAGPVWRMLWRVYQEADTLKPRNRDRLQQQIADLRETIWGDPHGHAPNRPEDYADD